MAIAYVEEWADIPIVDLDEPCDASQRSDHVLHPNGGEIVNGRAP